MPSTYSSNLKIELMSTGENSGTWGNITNTNLGTALEQAVVGYGAVSYASDANLTISITNSNAAQAARALVLNVTSAVSLTATRELVVPTIEKQYIVQNNTTGSQSITVKTSAGTGITVPNGRKAHLYVDGTNVIQMFDFVDINGGTIDGTPIGGSSAAAGAFTTLNASGATTLDGNVTLGNASGDNVTVTGTITSNLLFTDNTYDIGASGATRPRNLFLAGAATIGGNLSVGGTLTLTGGVNLNGNVTVGDNASDTLTINSTITSNLLFTDNTYDIGASGATRPRNLFLAGNATIGGNQTLTGALTVDSTTDSSSTTTGSIQTDGGLGVAKAAYIGTNLNVAGNTTLGDAAADTVTVNGTITSNLIFTDNTYDIGASGATRPRNLFIAGNITAGGNQTLTGSLTVDSTTDTSSATTGSIQTDGGVGIAKGLYVGGNTTLGDATADTVTINGTVTSNLIFTDNTYDIGASGATRPRTGYFATSVNIQSGQNAYGLWVGPTTGTWSVGGSTGIAFLVRNTAGGGVGGDGGGAYIEAYQPTTGNTGGLKFKTRGDATTVTTRYTIDDTGVSTWSVGGTATAMSLNATGLGLNMVADNGTLTILKNSTYSTESSAGICINSVNTVGYTSLLIGAADSINAGYIQSVAKSTSYSTKFLLLNPNGGNVGIGNITAPGNLLTVARTGGAATVQIISNTASQNTQVVFSSTVASWYIGQNITEASTGSLEFYNGTKQVSIASTGATYFNAQGAASYGAINLTNADPFIRYVVSSGTANKSKWDIRAISTGSTSAGNMLEFRTINDANTSFRSMLNLSYDGMLVVNPNQDNTGSLVRLYGGGTSQRGGYYSGDGTFSAGSSNYWEFGRDNASTGDFTFALNTALFWRMTTTGQWNRTVTADLSAINIYGSYTGNPEIVSMGQTSSDGYIRVKDAAGNTTYLTGWTGGVSYFSSKVSIGTSSPTSYFGSNFVVVKNGGDVVGFADTSGAAGNVVQTNKAGANGSDTTTTYIAFQRSDGTERGTIMATGTNGVVYNTTSDYRLKTVIGPVSGSGERIDALEPVEYIWNQDGSTERGFLAHKFKKVYSRSVSGEKDEVDASGKPKYQSMQASSSEVMADLVAEIQSLRKRLAAAGIA